MPTINDLRSALGPASEGRSDEELLSAYAQASGQHPNQVAMDFGYNPTNSGKWGLRGSASVDNAQSQLYGVAEAVGLGNWARRGRVSNKFQADVAQSRARAQGAIMGLDDVHGITDVPEYIGGLAIDSAPQMAATLGAGMAGGLPAAAAVGYGFATGDILENQREQSGKTDLLSASLLAVPYAAVDTLSGVGKLAAKAKFAKSGLKALDNLQGFAGGAARTAASMARTGVEEGIGETFQEGMNQLGRMAVDPNAQFLSEDAQKRYFESFVGGAALGGAVGGIGGHRRSDSYRAPGETPGAPMTTWDGKTPKWGTALGFDPAKVPDQNNPLGDIAPDWNFSDYAPGKADEGKLSFFEAPNWDLTSGFEGAKQINAKARMKFTPVEGTTVDEYTGMPADPNAVVDPTQQLAATAAVAPLNEQAQAQAAQMQAAQAEQQAAQEAATPPQLTPEQQQAQGRAQAIVEQANQVAAKVEQRTKQATALGLPADKKGKPAKAAFELYQQLADLHDAGKISDKELAENIGMLKANQNGNVRRFVKSIPIVRPDAPTSENTGEEGAVAPRTQGEVVAKEQVPTVAGIEADRTAVIGRKGRGKVVTPQQWLDQFAAADPEERKTFQLAMGLEEDIDPTTGAPMFVASGRPMKYSEIAKIQDTTKANVSARLKKFGIYEHHITQALAAGGLGGLTVTSEELGITPGDSAGMRTEDTASRATGQGLVNTAEDSSMTSEQRKAKAEADKLLKEAGPSTAVTSEVKASEGAVVTDLRAEREAKVQEFRAALLERFGEVGETWWDGHTPWASLPESLQIDWLEHLSDIETNYGSLESANEGAFEHAERLIEHDYAQYQANQRATEAPRADREGVERASLAASAAAPAGGKDAKRTTSSEDITDVEAREVTAEPQLSVSEERQGSTIARVLTEISKLNLGLDPKKVRIVQSVGDLPKLLQASLEGKQPQGFVLGGRAVLIADNIRPGNARAVLMHEIGVHMGLENLLSAKEFGRLANKVVDWADANDGSIESVLARKAIGRVGAAGTRAHQVHSETVAYFVEEAVRAGIDPTAIRYKSDLGRWMAELVRLLKAGLAKLKLIDAAGLTAQDVVDMAYGAAKLEMQIDQKASATPKMSVDNSELGMKQALRRLYEKAQDAYTDADSPEAAYNALFEAANPGEKSILRALKADDFLGFDYPHQALPELMREMSQPGFFEEDTRGNYDVSPNLKRAISRLGNKFGTPQFSIADHIPDSAKPAVDTVSTVFKDLAKNGLKKAMFTKDLARLASKHLESATKYVALVNEAQVAKMKKEREIARIVEAYEQLPQRERGTGPASVNAFLQESTMKKAWGYEPEYHKGVKVDGVMASKFKALSPAAQQLVKDVFKHGHENLLAMQEAVTQNIASEFDVLIAEAKRTGDKEALQKAKDEKAKALRDYETLMDQGGNWPYAPLKRFGNQVIVGMSQAYLDAVAEAKKTGNKDAVRAMQDEGQHYMVEFAETRREAIARRAELERSGAFAAVQDFERDDAAQALHGRDVLMAFGRLRNIVEDSEVTPAAAKALRGMLTDLHLSLLSERSAMQSGRFRKNIAGADKDMMRAFATQGRASAHFIANLENSDKINETLGKMREEADDVTAGDRRERRDYYNELMRRHAMNLEYKPTPLIEKAMKMSSVWMLLTSPAHFIVNATQPYVVSLPVMAGRHGYARASAALTKAYHDLAPLLKDGKLTDDDYKHLPADVREAINRLTDQGYIDISLERELGESDKGVTDKVVGKLRKVSETVEHVNRLSTAIAALRLERESNPNAGRDAHIAYAAKIINDTHGDYSGFNAPRIMRGGIGRLMTQFRKYQLIQISMYARLLHAAFKGATPDERKVGRRALAFSLGHMAILGGMLGMPGAQLIGAVLRQVFGDDDEPDNPELTLRKMIGDETMADLLIKGVPKMAGLDLSGRLGAGGMLSLLPYADVSMDRKGYEAAVLGALGPFFGGLMPNIADGVGKIGQGKYYEGLVKIAPKGLADFAKAYHTSTQGMTQKNGDQIMSPEEVTMVGALFQAMGLPTNTFTDRTFRANAKYQLDTFYKDKMGQMKAKYVQAYREGDTQEMNEIRGEWARIDAARRANGYKPMPLQDLLKAPAEAKKREAHTRGNLQYRDKDQGVVDMLDELS